MHSKEHDSRKKFTSRKKEVGTSRAMHGPDRRPGKLCKLRKAQTKLERKDDACHHPNSKTHREYTQPEAIDLQIQRYPSSCDKETL